MGMTLEAIGVVRSCFGGKFATPRQPGLCPSAWGRLEFLPGYGGPEALRGLEGFSHLWLIFGFHETRAQGWRATVRPPRLGGNERVGVFASRSTFRPNGLGLSLVRLEAISAGGEILELGGLDLIDGTPVYDIKPYLAYAEAVAEASCGYAGEAPQRLEVEVAEPAREDFARLPGRSQSVLLEALSLDPRPPAGSGDATRVFGAGLCGCNVRFVVEGGICRVLEIRRDEGSGLYA
jgi:tRNA (adenine37-N6)-methyltransferase